MPPLDREPVTAPAAPQHLPHLQQHQRLDQMVRVLGLVPVEKPDQEATRLLAALQSRRNLNLVQEATHLLAVLQIQRNLVARNLDPEPSSHQVPALAVLLDQRTIQGLTRFHRQAGVLQDQKNQLEER